MGTEAVHANDIVAAARRLSGRPPAETLAWAAERFAPRLAFVTGFGAEGCVLIDLIARRRLPIEVLTLDTGLLFDETYALWQRLEDRYGLTIRAVRPALSVPEQAAVHGERLWRRDPDRCCALRKVEPLQGALSGLAAWVTAIRREQTPERAAAQLVEWDPRFGLVKINPLVGWTNEDVWSYLREHDVPVNPLHARGYPSIGCEPCTGPVRAGEDLRAGRWRGREKTECGLHLRSRSPAAAPLLPLFVKLADRSVLLVGGGRVARAKLPSLVAVGARVRVVAPEVAPEIEASGVRCERRAFTPADLDGVWLAVAAATPEVNEAVARAADARRVFVNAVDDPVSASAYQGGVVRKGGVVLAVSTEGRAPALAGLLREALEASLPDDVGEWAAAAAELRVRQKAAGVPIERRRPALLEQLNRLYSEERP